MIKNSFLASASLIAFSLVANVASASAEQWYFYVQNNSRVAITRLLVAEPNKSWGAFDIGSGITAGETTKMIWDKSTDGQQCTQWIKAEFADGSESTPATINFCQDLDTPIVFQ